MSRAWICDLSVPDVSWWAWPCHRYRGAVIAAERCHQESFHNWCDCNPGSRICPYFRRGRDYIRPPWEPEDATLRHYASTFAFEADDVESSAPTPKPEPEPAPAPKPLRPRLCCLFSVRACQREMRVAACPAGKTAGSLRERGCRKIQRIREGGVLYHCCSHRGAKDPIPATQTGIGLPGDRDVD